MTRKGRHRDHRPIANPLRAWWEALATRPDAEALAKRFDCSRSMVYGLLDGTKGPSIELAARIEARTAGLVKASAWGRTTMRNARAKRRRGTAA